MDKETPVCFWNGKISDFKDAEAELKWIVLQNDLAIGKVENWHESGLL